MEKLLNLVSEIKNQELIRVQLKKELLDLEGLKLSEQKIIDLIEHSANCRVYLNDIEKKYTNDAARKAGVKQLCIESSDYEKSISELERFNKEISENEMSLRLNQIEIDYLKRELEVYTIFAKAGV